MRRHALICLLAVGLSLAAAGGCLAAEGKNLIFALGAEPVSLDPANQTDNPSEIVVRHIHDNLVEFTEKGDIVPQLAASWETSADGLTWTFKLRQGVRFHDGTPFNAQAVVFNIKRNTDPAKRTLRTSLYEPFIADARALDDYTLEIKMKKPFGALLAHFAHGAGGMISPAALQKHGDKYGLNPVGTGPYVFVEWKAGDRVVVKRNDAYWKGQPKIEGVIFKPVPEAASRVIMLETGEADVVFPVPLMEVERLNKGKTSKIILGDTARVIYIGMHQQKKPFNDKRVRQAVNYAVDKESIIKNVLMGMAKPSKSVMGALVWGAHPVGEYKHDVEKAKKLLAEAGYPNGFEVNLWTPDGRYPMDAQIAEAVATQLAKVGVKVKIQRWEWAAYQTNTRKPPEEAKYDMFLLGWAPSTGDADWAIRPLLYSSEWMPKGDNRSYYKNANADALIKQGMETSDQSKRREIYKKAQEVLVEDGAWLMLHDMVQSVGVSNKLNNVAVWPIEIVLVKDASWSN